MKNKNLNTTDDLLAEVKAQTEALKIKNDPPQASLALEKDKRLEGNVKFYSKDKGFGFIYVNGQDDIFFGINEWKDASVPSEGDLISFNTEPSKKGLRAKNILLISRTKIEHNSRPVIDKIKCPSCNRNVIPRLVTNYGQPAQSFCPFCGGTIRDFRKTCFVATAVYGQEHPKTILLRAYRDNELALTLHGRAFIKIYYKIGPLLASMTKTFPPLSKFARYIIDATIENIVTWNSNHNYQTSLKFSELSNKTSKNSKT